MRRRRSPRSPAQRLALIVGAIAVMLLGYQLGSRYQVQELQRHGAIVVEQPVALDIAALSPDLQTFFRDGDTWVVFLAGEPGAACDRLLDQYIEVYNRLAAYPQVQAALHLALLHSSDASSENWTLYDWATTHRLEQDALLAITAEAGIAPIGNRWCSDVQATAALTGPGAEVHALLPLDKPAEMAESLRLFFETFAPDA